MSSSADGTAIEMRPDVNGYHARCEELIDFFADRPAAGYIDYIEFIEVAARLYRDRPLGDVVPALEELLENPHGDMFWMYPMVLILYLGRERLPEEHRARLRDLWRTYTPYRGDTENHWVMYYTSLYLMAQLYPNDPPESWFNGRSSEENRREAETYLCHWVDLTTRLGQGEYDSPHYMPFFVTPMALLYAFAENSRMKKLAEMMLDYVLADFAVDTLDGLYVGAFSRIYPEPTLERWRNGSTTFSWLLFGNVPLAPDGINVILQMPGYRPHGVAVILAMSGYVPHEIIVKIATEREQSYVHRELKRTRHRIRNSGVRNAPVYKYVHMTSDYALGSTQGGLLQPIQQHTWEFFWRAEHPHDGFNVLFTVHPYSSPHELAMYFPEEPQLMTEAVLKGKKETYDSPNKWTGGSPYEQVFQHEDALIALYDIPDGTRFPHISGYFSRRLSEVTEEDGWIFARAGEAYVALRPLAPYEWRDAGEGDRRLHSPHLKNGAILQVAPTSAFVSAELFRSAVIDLRCDVTLDPVPQVRYQTLSGDSIDVLFGSNPRLNGSEVDYNDWPLFGGPFLQAEKGSKRLDMHHGERARRLDFRSFSAIDLGTQKDSRHWNSHEVQA